MLALVLKRFCMPLPALERAWPRARAHRLAPSRSDYVDYNLAARLACPQISKGFGNLAQWVPAIDHWGEFSGFGHFLQRDEMLIPHPGQERDSRAGSGGLPLGLNQTE